MIVENLHQQPLVGPVEGAAARHEWRGLLIDSARTCYAPETIETILHLASRYGFNRLHWHLTDDQGWRFEVPGYPRLTEVGGKLPRPTFSHYTVAWEDSVDRAAEQAPGRWRGGFYTDDEIRHLTTVASSLGIEIVPEVDFPGHMAAAIQAYPEIGRPEGLPLPSGSMRETMYWPAQNDLLWPTDAALDLVEAALTRIADLFPGRYIHIGGDECAYKQWESDPDLAQWLARNGVGDYPGIQAWFMRRGIEVIRGLGRTPMAWDEACDLVGDDVVIVAWDEDAGMARIAQASQKYVFADARSLYLNRVDPHAGADQKGMVAPLAVEDILSAAWPEVDSDRCLGVQACLWSEFILDEDDLLAMAFPRLLAVAARLWQMPEDADLPALIAAEYEVLQAALAR